MRITTWGDRVRDVDDSTLQTLNSPIIMAFAGFRVTEYRGFNTLYYLTTPTTSVNQPNLNETAASILYINPDIPEVLSYHHH